jgi:hypothetical protein
MTVRTTVNGKPFEGGFDVIGVKSSAEVRIDVLGVHEDSGEEMAIALVFSREEWTRILSAEQETKAINDLRRRD